MFGGTYNNQKCLGKKKQPQKKSEKSFKSVFKL